MTEPSTTCKAIIIQLKLNFLKKQKKKERKDERNIAFIFQTLGSP